ncbi:MAG: MXAN_6640 family putative metalloprotease [Marmoricola sp.]
MRTSQRTSLVAVLATLSVLALPLVSTASAAPPVARDTAAAPTHHGYTRAQAAAILKKVEAALTPRHTAPRKLGDPLPRQDLTLLLRQAQQARSKMSARGQSIIDNTSSRPVPDGVGCADYTPFLQAAWKAAASAHFCVHYRAGANPAAGDASATQAQTTLNTMEYVYSREVAGMGYRAPLLDSDGKYDVFLDQLGDQGYYGFCTTDGTAATGTAWCGLDNDFAVGEFGAPPLNSLRVTAAHEFFHAVQFAYDANDSTWFLEGTAVWMEDQVYPTINDYLQYLPVSQIVRPRQSSDSETGLEVYGTVTFWKFLSEHFKDVSIIRRVWESAAASAGYRNGIQAVAAVLAARHTSLAAEFARYAVWNLLPPGTYADRALFPAPGYWASATLTRGARDTGNASVRVNHLSSAPLLLRPGARLPLRTKLRVSVDGPNRGNGTQARLLVRLRSGRAVTYVITLNAAGNGTKVVGFNPRLVRSAVVSMADGSSVTDNLLFTVRARISY